jgi:hypothetical protein
MDDSSKQRTGTPSERPSERELRDEELDKVSGGTPCTPPPSPSGPIPIPYPNVAKT